MKKLERLFNDLWEQYILCFFSKTKYSLLILILSYLTISIVLLFIKNDYYEMYFLFFGFPIVYGTIVFGIRVGFLVAMSSFILNNSFILFISSHIEDFNELIVEGVLGSLIYFICCIFFSNIIKREKELLNKYEKLTDELTRSSDELALANMEINNLYTCTIQALASAIEAKDEYTIGHSERVTNYAMAIAKELLLPTEKVKEILYASILHDIGKIGINENILSKPGRLTEEEYEQIKQHPSIGANILSSIKVLEPVIPIVYHHHEFYNGKGYPTNKAKSDIPLGARIIAVADAFDAMTSDRPYRKGFSKEKALNEIINSSGTQFDPMVVKVFEKIISKEDKYKNQDFVAFLYNDRIS